MLPRRQSRTMAAQSIAWYVAIPGQRMTPGQPISPAAAPAPAVKRWRPAYQKKIWKSGLLRPVGLQEKLFLRWWGIG